MDFWVSVTQPGPVEQTILEELRPTMKVADGVQQDAALRYLEGGEGRDLVLLHGRGHASTTWYPLLPALTSRFRVIAIDLPGFGHSGPAPFHSDEPEDALAYFVLPIERRLEAMGILSPIIVGHSLGGLVSLELALRGRIRPSHLVLIGSMGLGPEMLPVARAFFQAGPERLTKRLGKLVNRLSRGPGRMSETVSRLNDLEVELYTLHGSRRHPAQAFKVLAPTVSPIFHRGERLSDVSPPSLLIWGDRDEVFPVEVATRAAERMSRSELLVLPAGHAPHWEQPELITEHIMAFADRFAEQAPSTSKVG